MPGPSRRHLLGLAAAGLFVPRRLARAEGGSGRKFLFVFNAGGWDPSMVFAPVFSDQVDHGAGEVAAEEGGIAFTDAPSRPSVRRFFERWADRTCVVNGLQVPSLAHDVCTRLVMTGDARPSFDDWASLVAGLGGADRLLPNLHLSGPLFPNQFATASVRVGLVNQLPALALGTANQRMDGAPPAPDATVEALEEAWYRARVEEWGRGASGLRAELTAAERIALDRMEQMPGVADVLTVADPESLFEVSRVALRAMASGLCRTAMVGFGEGGNGDWDTHTRNQAQDSLFEELFATLDALLEELRASPGELGPSLLDETTVVVLSEMGRTPELNSSGGKDHWPWTSAMLVGSGVAGGRTVGAWTDGLGGELVDLRDGTARADGVTLLPGHLGATLLALADIDPGPWVAPEAGAVIEAVLADS